MSELSTAAARLNPHESPGRRWAATVVSLLVVVGLTILDASWSEIISATVVVAPFFAAMFAGVRQTALVALRGRPERTAERDLERQLRRSRLRGPRRDRASSAGSSRSSPRARVERRPGPRRSASS